MEEKNKFTDSAWNQMLRDGIRTFLDVAGINQKKYAEIYGTTEQHLSNILNWRKTPDIVKIVNAANTLGYVPDINVDRRELRFMPLAEYEAEQRRFSEMFPEIHGNTEVPGDTAL